MNASAPLLSLRRATVHLGAVRALDAVELTLLRGDRMVLVGANGSGKTTLLRLLHGLLPCDGERLQHPLPSGRAPVIAMLFQRPFLINLSARANVMLGLWLQNVPRSHRPARCEQALRRVGLAELSHRSANTLSVGQQQRLALARAWALQPDLLLLDEPTASLDPGAKREVEELIEEIAADGVTVVLSTHNLGQAKRLATRVVYLESGRLLVDRPTRNFFDDPLPAAAAAFVKGELPWA